MSSQRDYTSYSFLTTILVIAAMAGLSQLPRFKLGSLTFKRTNILADIIKQEESPELLEADQYFDTTFLNEAAAMKVIDSATRSAERDTLSLPEAKLEEWNIATDTPVAAPILPTKPAGADQNVVPIELFSPDAMMRFNRALTRGAAGRPVRIAVLGDSFIEGDIITADLREQLQNLCGGRGVGFRRAKKALPCRSLRRWPSSAARYCTRSRTGTSTTSATARKFPPQSKTAFSSRASSAFRRKAPPPGCRASLSASTSTRRVPRDSSLPTATIRGSTS